MNADSFLNWVVNCSQESFYFQYDSTKTRRENIARAQNRVNYSFRGHNFRSLIHLNAIDSHTEQLMNRTVEESDEKGLFYYLQDEIFYNPATKKWSLHHDGSEKIVHADIVCVDKIKVWTAPYYCLNMSRRNSVSGLEGNQDQNNRKNISGDTNVFLHEVMKVADPPATVARYKSTEPYHQMHAHCFHAMKLNRTNINMPRGIHEYVLGNRTVIAHNLANNFPHGRMTLELSQNSENNNSLTIDSGINSVINGLTFKANATEMSEHKGSTTADEKSRREIFPLAPLVRFGTHQTLINCKRKKDGIVRPTAIQVHERAINASAVTGPTIIKEICQKCCQLFSHANGMNIKTSLALNNCKSFLSKKSRSLMWGLPNALCDLHCWENNTHRMTPEEEMTFFRDHCVPMLDSLMLCRDNYAQTGNFCQQTPLVGPFYSYPDLKLMSHRFKNIETNRLFRRSQTRFPDLYKHHVSTRNSKKPSTTIGRKKAKHPKTKDYRSKTLAQPMSRNEGVVRSYELGPKVFRLNFHLPPPSPTSV